MPAFEWCNTRGTPSRPLEVTENVLDSDSFIGDHPAVQLLDGVTNSHRFELRIPNDFGFLIRAFVVVIPAGSGNMDRGVTSMWGACLENYNVGSANIPSGFVPVVINQETCIDITDALQGIARNDEVGLTFTRRGGVAGDTVGATVYLIKVVMQYAVSLWT